MADDNDDIPGFLRRDTKTDTPHLRREAREKAKADADAARKQSLDVVPHDAKHESKSKSKKDRVKAVKEALMGEAHTRAQLDDRYQHHSDMSDYHRSAAINAEKKALKHMGTPHEHHWNKLADHHNRRADRHENAAETAAQQHLGRRESVDEGKMKAVDTDRKERERLEGQKKQGLSAKKHGNWTAKNLEDAGFHFDSDTGHWKKKTDEGVDAVEAKRRGMTSDQARKQADSDAKRRRKKAVKEIKEIVFESRGRPRNDGTPAEEPDEHPVAQLRKAVSLRGQHQFKFREGKPSKVAPGAAKQALDKYSSLQHPSAKQSFADRLWHSKQSFQRAVGEGLDTINSKKGEK